MDFSGLFGLDGRTALITGASGGLGRHFAEVLGGAGARVVLTARRRQLIDHAAEEIRHVGGEAIALQMDVTAPEQIATALDDAEAHFGGIDILVNNAGVTTDSWFTNTPDEEWRRVMDVNLDGVRNVAEAAAKRMKARGAGGAIINIASVLGLGVLPRVSAYAVSKAAVVQLTRAMAVELARDGIRVNALAPGYFATDMNRDFLASDAGQKLLARVPFGRVGEESELDGALLLLASPAGSFITGAVLPVDGGALLGLG